MTPTDSAEKVVAEWRAAMEGVTLGEWHDRVTRTRISVRSPRGGICTMAIVPAPYSTRAPEGTATAAWIARCNPVAITALLDALEASQAREAAAEARVTALEAEKAGLVKALTDPVVVHRSMLAGSIAKPSAMNIAHLYPEVQQTRQALIATLKHFRHPTSAEHETRDKVMAALALFGELPLTPMAQALSRSSTEAGDA